MGLILRITQFTAALILGLVAGSVFSIWRGYDPAAYTAATFVQTHQGAVGGLNVLLPGLAMVAIALTAALAWFARHSRSVLVLYLGALLLMATGGVITRFFNQPINAEVMTWTTEAVPLNWSEVRASWWYWHLLRTGVTIVSFALLLAAMILDRAPAQRLGQRYPSASGEQLKAAAGAAGS